MFVDKQPLSTSNPPRLHLPAVGNAADRRRTRQSEGLYNPTRALQSDNYSGNVSALKAKYTDYIAWLNASTRNNSQPVLTQQLLKHSLCQMGIGMKQADRLVSTCRWYVYQFQKDLQIDSDRIMAVDVHEDDKRQGRHVRHRPQNATPTQALSGVLGRTLLSSRQNGSSHEDSLPSMRQRPRVLPTIHISDASRSSSTLHRSDFDRENAKDPVNHHPSTKSQQHSSHGESTDNRTQTLPKVSRLSRGLSQHVSNDVNAVANVDTSSSHRNQRRHGFVAGHARSILRKQASTSCSTESTDAEGRKMHGRLLTSSSTLAGDVPMGTRSQRLFGGSEYFVQILNELEQQQTPSLYKLLQ